MVNIAKKQIVKDLLKNCEESESILFVNFKGLSVLLERELRSSLKKNNSFMKVAKVRLVKIALRSFGVPESSWPEMDSMVDEQLAVVFVKQDSQIVARELFAFQKKSLDGEFVVGGVYNKGLCAPVIVKAWSRYPVSKDMIVQRLAATLISPLSALARILAAVSNKKEV